MHVGMTNLRLSTNFWRYLGNTKLLWNINRKSYMIYQTVTATVTEALVLPPPPTRRPRAHHRVNPYLGARRQNETKMFSDHDETNPSIATVSAPSVACSVLAKH